MAINNMGVIHPRLKFAGIEILSTFWFLCHNFGSKYARKPMKGSKDSNGSLVSKTNRAKKLAHWISVQGHVKWAIKTQKQPHL